MRYSKIPDRKITLYIALFVIVSLSLAISFTSIIQAPDNNFADINQLTDSPPIVLITLESVRSHNIGPCYGYERNTAPNICDVSEDGVIFENAYAQGTATTMAIPSLVTGDLPAAVAQNDIGDPLLDGAEPVTDTLEQNGYRTVGFIDTVQGELIDSPLMSEIDELNGWKSYNRSEMPAALEKDGKTLIWMFGRNTTHKPYRPQSEHRKWENYSNPSYKSRDPIGSKRALENSSLDRADLEGLYDGAIAAEDHRIGAVIKSMKERNLYNKSLIVITGDHGESFGAHENYGHGDGPVEEQTRVPLIIKMPGNKYAGTSVSTPVRHMDIVPTIKDYLGLSSEETVEGRSLIPHIRGEGSSRNVVSGMYPLRIYSIQNEEYKLQMQNPKERCLKGDRGLKQLFELKSGVSDRVDISRENEDVVSNLTLELCNKFSEAYERRINNLDNS